MVAPSAAVPADGVMSSACRADDLDEISFLRNKIYSDGSPSDRDVDQILFSYEPHEVPDDIRFRKPRHSRE